MSHIATVDVEIKDLDCLEKAAARLGLEFNRDKTTFRWYGHFVGDYKDHTAKLKELGIDPKDYGKCQHTLSVPGNSSAYEVGVVAKPGGGFVLLWDFWNGGFGLMEKLSADADKQRIGVGKLQQAYAVEVAKKGGSPRWVLVQGSSSG
jgi:hypothetical protein